MFKDKPFSNNLRSNNDGDVLYEEKDRLSEVVIRNALHKTRGNISKAARMLNVPRSTLKYRSESLPIKNALSNTMAEGKFEYT